MSSQGCAVFVAEALQVGEHAASAKKNIHHAQLIRRLHRNCRPDQTIRTALPILMAANLQTLAASTTLGERPPPRM
jgi:hypothetical protein